MTFGRYWGAVESTTAPFSVIGISYHRTKYPQNNPCPVDIFIFTYDLFYNNLLLCGLSTTCPDSDCSCALRLCREFSGLPVYRDDPRIG